MFLFGKINDNEIWKFEMQNEISSFFSLSVGLNNSFFLNKQNFNIDFTIGQEIES